MDVLKFTKSSFSSSNDMNFFINRYVLHAEKNTKFMSFMRKISIKICLNYFSCFFMHKSRLQKFILEKYHGLMCLI